jgi:hypothetical protein
MWRTVALAVPRHQAAVVPTNGRAGRRLGDQCDPLRRGGDQVVLRRGGWHCRDHGLRLAVIGDKNTIWRARPSFDSARCASSLRRGVSRTAAKSGIDNGKNVGGEGVILGRRDLRPKIFGSQTLVERVAARHPFRPTLDRNSSRTSAPKPPPRSGPPSALTAFSFPGSPPTTRRSAYLDGPVPADPLRGTEVILGPPPAAGCSGWSRGGGGVAPPGG